MTSVKLANDVTYKRMNFTMNKLQKMSDSETSPFLRVMFGQSSVAPVSQSDIDELKIDWFSDSLNDSQKDAIKFAMAAQDVALIHGPPGTGKTTTLIELILQFIKQGKRLLVCGPSNISVDNIVEKLSHHKVPIVRVGHPARLLPSVLSHSLDVLTQTSDAAEIVRDVRKEMDSKQASIRKTKSGRERRAIYLDLRELRKEFRIREKKCVENLVTGSKVVLATLHGAGGFHLRGQRFDAVIIDEASQALEAQCWVPLLDAKKVVLAGDHLQLPPTIKSQNEKVPKDKDIKKDKEQPSEKGGNLEVTLFDRLLKIHGNKIKRMLNTQYRMHEKIVAFPSVELYESKLLSAEAVKTRLLKDLPYSVEDTDDTREPLVFWDTQGGDFAEKSEEEDKTHKPGPGLSLGESKSNPGEAALVKVHVQSLVAAGLKPEDIAVITPYNAQVALLSRLLKEEFLGIEIGSVDGFQGREKEAVVVSLVRSGSDVGFLAEKRRLNVSMTRPKRHLCVIGDSGTLAKGSAFLKRWTAHLEEHADLRYPDISELEIPSY
jgi:DNA polymerase alpha-associated DNA helicase A